MNNKIYRFLIVTILVVSFVKGEASNKSYIYNAYVTNNTQGWRDLLDKLNNAPQKSNEYLLEIINYHYGYIGWCVGYNKSDDAYKYLEIAEKYLAILENNKYNMSMVHAYKSAFNGFKIGLNIFKAPFLGQACMDGAMLSMKINPSNPFGIIQYANIQYYMPPLFGGSKTEALEYYIKAKELMEKNNSETDNWYYLNLLMSIGQSYEALDRLMEAKATYEYVLSIEPEFKWVNRVYPKLLETIKEKK